MYTDVYRDLIRDAYRGELKGIAFFRSLLEIHTAEAEIFPQIKLLQSLEEETAARLKPLLEQHQLSSVDEIAANAEGCALANRFPTWASVVGFMRQELPRYRSLYDELEGAASPSDAATLSFLAWHERALVEFFDAAGPAAAAAVLERVRGALGKTSSHD